MSSKSTVADEKQSKSIEREAAGSVRQREAERYDAMRNVILTWLNAAKFSEAAGVDADAAVTEITQNTDKYLDIWAAADWLEATSANYAALKEEFGLYTEADMRARRKAAREKARRAARDEIRAQLDIYGVEAVMAAVDGEEVDPKLEQRVADVLAEVKKGKALYSDEIEQAQQIEAEIEASA